MKQTLTLLVAVLFFSFPMAVQADPGKQDMSKATPMKPLSAMKSTMQSPSDAAMGKKAAEQPLEEVGGMAGKAKEESSDAAKGMIDDTKKMGAKKGMDQQK